MRNFSLTTSFPGYNNKVDSSKLIPGVLVSGSHDVYSVDGLRILSRPGFTRVGIANTALYPILSSYDWTTSGGVERNVRCYNDRIEVLYEGVWMPIITGLTGVSFNFDEWWNATEIKDEILMANGSPNLYAWNGAIAEIASVTADSLTKTGVETWAENRFYVDAGSQKKVMIDGVEYTYTGGEGTTTLTGVTPSPDGTDQSQITQNAVQKFGESDLTGKVHEVAQSFVAGNATIDGVKLWKTANTGTLTLGYIVAKIYTDNAGVPDVQVGGAQIAMVDYNALPVGEFSIDFASPLTITPASTYWIRVSFFGTSDDSNHPNLGSNSAGGYASGAVKGFNTVDGWTPIATVDLYFKTFRNYTVVNGDLAIQKVVTNANLISATYNIDIIAVLNNQLWLADSGKRDVYVSKANDYTDFTFDMPRNVGQGAVLTLDSSPKGFAVQEQYMWISAGTNLWYQSDITLAADNTAESLTVKRLKTAPQQGALSQSAIGKMKNNTVFISHEPTLDFLGNVENISTTQSTVISDPIKKDFDSYDFSTNVNLKYYKNNLYIAIPNESKLLIYNLDGRYWEAPWNVPAGRLAIIDGDLCIHSNAVPETYKLFDSYSDNGNPINAVAKFAYNLYDNPSQVKNFTEWLTVGYITGSTDLNLKLDYEYRGFGGSVTKQILGDDTDIVLSSLSNANLGKDNLGKEKLGGSSEAEDINKFRAIRTFVPSDFYEIQPEYSSYGEDQRWELLLFGGDITLTNYDNTSIKD